MAVSEILYGRNGDFVHKIRELKKPVCRSTVQMYLFSTCIFCPFAKFGQTPEIDQSIIRLQDGWIDQFLL
jgi:hypothetical protein